MNILMYALKFLLCLGQVLLAIYFFDAFAKKRFSSKIMALIVSFVSIMLGTSFLILNNQSILFIISVLITVILSLVYNLKWYIGILLSVIFSVISGLFDLFVMLLLSLIGYDPYLQDQSLLFYIFGSIIAKTFTFLTVLIIRKSGHKSFNHIRTSHFLGLLMLPCSTIVISMLLTKFIFLDELGTAWKIGAIIAMVFLILENAMIFYVVDAQYKIIHIEEELKTSHALLENEKQYYNSIFNSQKDIRKIRHDLKNIFIAALGELNLGKTESAKKILQSQLDEVDNYVPINEDTGLIDAVIYSKYQLAEKNNVKLNVDERIDEKIVIDGLDLCVLIGNILDNAIEAACECEQAVVNFKLVTDNDNLIILCDNPTVNKIFNRDILKTTKKDKENHGFGMLSIISIAEKYNGSYVYECENGIFTSTAILINHC